MRHRNWMAALALVAVAAMPVQGQRGGMAGSPRFDTATVETITGTVQRVDTIAGPGAGAGIHMQLRSGSETIPVHLGPAWYLERNRVQLTAGEQVTVRGSRVTYQGAPAILAADITHQGQRFQMRDRNGIPRWGRASQPRRGGRQP